MFKLNAFQKYYAILDYYNRKKLSKLDGDCRFEYHHVKPKSIFGENDNLIVVVPLSTHCYLHKLLVEYYASCTNEAIKMNYAFDVIKNRSKTTDEMLSIVDEFAKSCWFTRNKKNYSYLLSRYSINVESKRERNIDKNGRLKKSDTSKSDYVDTVLKCFNEKKRGLI